MLSSFAQWLATLGWTAFSWALGGLLVFNAAAIGLLLMRRDSATVQRYTSLWLAGNLLLVSVGVGVPAVTAVARLALFTAGIALPQVAVGDGQTPV